MVVTAEVVEAASVEAVIAAVVVAEAAVASVVAAVEVTVDAVHPVDAVRRGEVVAAAVAAQLAAPRVERR